MTKLAAAFFAQPIAHRGYHATKEARPENSRAACQAALKAGYGIEIDIQLTTDQVPVVFHDDTLDCLTAHSGALRDLCAQDLCKIPLNGSTETITRLDEILDLIAGKVPLLVELKDQTGQLGPSDGSLERAVLPLLAQYHGPKAVMSFNPHMMAHFHAHAPKIAHGLVTEAFDAKDWPKLDHATRQNLREMTQFERLGACFISHDVNDLTADRPQALRQSGLPLLCWTVRTQAQEISARKFCDNITFEGYAAQIVP